MSQGKKGSEKTKITDTNFIVCDVETTGISPHYNRITEISLIKVTDEEITDKFTTLINPKQHIPLQITYLTGITNEDVQDRPVFDDVAPQIRKFIGKNGSNNTVFVGHNASFDFSFLNESFRRLKKPDELKLDVLCTCKLARRLLRKLKSKSLGSVATHLGIKQAKKHRAYDDTLATAKILLYFLEILQDEYEFETTDELLKFQNSKIFTADNKPLALKRLNLNLKDIPEQPGVYFMKSSSGEILYIGKAKSLKERVSTYFRHNENLSRKIKKLLSSIRALEFEITDSELSALILESKMIKKHKPRFNTAIKRFRFHPFLKLDVQNEFPKIDTVYEIENDGAYYYGPFSSRGTVRQIYRDIYENFNLRKCEDKSIKASLKNSNCLYFDIGKCGAPCNTTITKEEYLNEVNKVHNFITGNRNFSATANIRRLMSSKAETLDYERAALLRDRLKDIEKVMSYQKVITSAINDKKIIIKCDNGHSREVFFIHNGKLMKTLTLSKDNEYDQRDTIGETEEAVDYLYFSLSKYIRHKYSQEELDEIKVISNWIAINRDRNSILEIHDKHTKKEIVKFIFN